MGVMELEKKELAQLTEETCKSMIEAEHDDDIKRMIGLFSKRQMELLDILDYIRIEEKAEETEGEKNTICSSLFSLLTHPIVGIVLGGLAAVGICVMGFTAVSVTEAGIPIRLPFSGWVLPLLAVLLFTGQSVLSMMKRQKKTESVNSAVFKPELDLILAKKKLQKVLSCYPDDSKTIRSFFTVQSADRRFAREMADVYTEMYQVRLDHPKVSGVDYPLTQVQIMLQKMGFSFVDYSPEHESLFEIQEASYPNQMRFPAIVETNTGEIFKRGEYIRNTEI